MVFLYGLWLKLPLTTRAILAKEFGFSKVGPTHVFDNRIISDGYKLEDVEERLNIDAIQKYTGSDNTDMQVLWDLMVAKAENRVPENEVAAIVEEVIVINDIVVEPKKRKYTRKTK